MPKYASDDENVLATIETLGGLKEGELLEVGSDGQLTTKTIGLWTIIPSLSRKDLLFIDLRIAFGKGFTSARKGEPLYPSRNGGKRAVTRDNLDRALAGFERYIKTLKTGRLVLDAAKLEMDRLPDEMKHASFGMDSHFPIYEKYARFCLFKIDQKQFLDPKIPGVCLAFVWDWLRRKYGLNKRGQVKDSYAVSKNAQHNQNPQSGPFDPAHLARMQKKVDKSIAAVQAHYTKFSKEMEPEIKSRVVKEGEYYTKESEHIKKGFPSLFGDADSGLDFSFYPSASGPTENMDWSKLGEMGPAFAKKFAAELLKNVKDCSSLKLISKSDLGLFKVSLHRKGAKSDSAEHSSHAIGIHVRDAPNGGVQVFDPNIGDFFFPGQEDAIVLEFLADLWTFYSMHDSFKVQAVYCETPSANNTIV